jgi:hypothetical protein
MPQLLDRLGNERLYNRRPLGEALAKPVPRRPNENYRMAAGKQATTQALEKEN